MAGTRTLRLVKVLPPKGPVGFPLRRAQVVLGLAIVLLSFAVRAYRLDGMRLEFDEAFSVQAGFRDFPAMFQLLATSEPHPPLFYSLIHVWYPVFGTTEFALRFPSLLANVATVALVIRLGALLGWPDAGLVAGLLLALNPYQVWYSQEVRMYAPVACFGLAAACFAVQFRRTGRARDVARYALFIVLALYTHYFAIFLAAFFGAAVGIDLLLDPPGRVALRRWLVAHAAVAALFLPWLAYASQVGLHYIRATPNPRDLVGVVVNSLAYYSVGRSIDSGLGARLALGFLGVVVVGLLAGRWLGAPARSGFRLAFLIGYLLFPLSAGFLVSLVRSMYAPNYLMVSGPAFYLALGLGVVALARVLLPLGVVALLYLGAAQADSLRNYFVDPVYNKAEAGDAMVYVEQHLRPGDAIVLDGLGQTTQFWYYHDVRFGDRGPSYVFPLPGADGPERMAGEIDQLLARHQGVWFLDYGVQDVDRQHVVERYLDQHAYLALYHPVQSNRVLYFATATGEAPEVRTVGVTCDGAIEVRDATQFRTSARAGSVVPLALTFRSVAATNRQFVVSWRLTDAAGHVVSQRDSEPASGTAPTNTWSVGSEVEDRYGMLLPAALPPGRYSAETVIYDKATGAACPLGGAVASAPAALTLGTIDVPDGPPELNLVQPTPSHRLPATTSEPSLLGYDLEPGPYHPGETVSPRLYWRLGPASDVNWDLEATLADARGVVLQRSRSPLGPSDYPTSRWLPERVLAASLDLMIPPRATSGVDRLTLRLLAPNGDTQTLASSIPISVVARARQFDVPKLPNPVAVNAADFAGAVSLLGFDLSPAPTATIRPGQSVALTLYWRDEQELPTSFKVFTHLVGTDGQIYGQEDGIPLDGAAPTNGWVPGEVLTDHYQFVVAPNAPPGNYRVEVGFYDPETGMRLPLRSGPDSYTVASVHVEPG